MQHICNGRLFCWTLSHSTQEHLILSGQDQKKCYIFLKACSIRLENHESNQISAAVSNSSTVRVCVFVFTGVYSAATPANGLLEETQTIH